MKFDQSLVNAKESSVAPSVSADVEPAASDDMHQFESTLAALPHPGHKSEPSQQHPAQTKVPQPEKRPKKRLKKAEDISHNANWDSDQSSQVVTLASTFADWQGAFVRERRLLRCNLKVHDR